MEPGEHNAATDTIENFFNEELERCKSLIPIDWKVRKIVGGKKEWNCPLQW